MNRKDIQLILLFIIATALVVIAIQLLFPPQPPESTFVPTYGQEGISQVEPAKYAYVASANSEVFHKSSCKYVAKIREHNLVGFETKEDAINSGRRPCKVCGP